MKDKRFIIVVRSGYDEPGVTLEEAAKLNSKYVDELIAQLEELERSRKDEDNANTRRT
jgi:hypothetical protein